VLPTVLVATAEPEEIVVSTGSVVYGLDETAGALAPVEETALYKVVLPTVLVIVLESEVTVAKTASVE
jgi:hypothetical protein